MLDKYYRIEKKGNSFTSYNRESYCSLCSQSKGRNVKLIPSRLVVSCKYGHLDDFPYDWWVHRKKGKCGNSKLSIEISKTISGLEGILIKCQCGAQETLEGIMDRGALHQRRCYGAMPWLGKKDGMKGWFSADGNISRKYRSLNRFFTHNCCLYCRRTYLCSVCG